MCSSFQPSKGGLTSWALASLHERTDVHLLALQEHAVNLRGTGKRSVICNAYKVAPDRLIRVRTLHVQSTVLLP